MGPIEFTYTIIRLNITYFKSTYNCNSIAQMWYNHKNCMPLSLLSINLYAICLIVIYLILLPTDIGMCDTTIKLHILSVFQLYCNRDLYEL